MPTTRHARFLTALCALAALWVVVYWIWDAGPRVPAGGAMIATREEPEVHWRDVKRIDRPPQPAGFASTLDAVGNSPVESHPTQVHLSDDSVPSKPPFAPHVVEHGETWASIAQRFFGDRSLSTSLVRANPFKDPRMLREGDVILIPADPYNVQGAPAGMGPGDGGAIINAQSSPADAPPVVDTTQQQIPSGKPYRIRKNDVLSRISLREYRTIKYAQVLFERNKAQLDIDKLELIRPGQVIYIPDRETIEHEYREFMAKDPTE